MNSETSDSTARLRAPVDLGDGLTPVDVWQSLHAGERRWAARTAAEERLPFAGQMDASDRQLMALLGAFPATRWVPLCEGAGWTPIAVAALTWCEGATLTIALRAWTRLDPAADPLPGTVAERAARFLNPALLPENTLSVIGRTAGTLTGLAVLLRARSEPPFDDLSAEQKARLPEATRTVLLSYGGLAAG
ncbi:hypothetical protein [Methylobacterium radiotolerans]|uniref:Uncharacterized protein n=1 Tax=Methylobacterium radiotolerans (strain ATCC 27329 / DSM 1819 / JCM 2831 / NBRC 15690 / NCIMB 10815 / 0-1) TaxID=426355 RepID=B1M1Y2_METRJ|nr:hypothetical protein [Methylobacterium radiotolerans]ACB23167.1 hypothetical protein Mrad2831_1158 [Methylobacterium radiotolerans JCM 2831]GEN00372.1 hypothetical protein MRA01_49110 [Methylobacterium radiotolerans]